MLEKKLQEELERYRSINRYTTKLMLEQEVPAPPPPDAGAAPTDVPPPDAGAAPTDVPPADPTAAPIDTPPADDTMGDTEELDITDLVNMTKSIKKDLENNTQDNSGVVSKMDDIFTKLDDLESKISQMDTIISKIDSLGAKIDSVKPKTPEEKLEMRSLDSYPFNKNPQEFFNDKQQEMRMTGKNEYVLTKNDINNYSNDDMRKSFNPDTENDEFKY